MDPFFRNLTDLDGSNGSPGDDAISYRAVPELSSSFGADANRMAFPCQLVANLIGFGITFPHGPHYDHPLCTCTGHFNVKIELRESLAETNDSPNMTEQRLAAPAAAPPQSGRRSPAHASRRQVFPRQGNLTSHMFLHSARPHDCNLCSVKFARKHDLRRHMRTVHSESHCVRSESHPFRCGPCNRSFYRENHYRLHLAKESH
ncbi:hypothetical protein DFJ73DRAFT_230989 [Zopfochytrium polystomum]|nr:hypothetical protein DFJ73DRAFT_230989 [Zopfochytrium polystomum]